MRAIRRYALPLTLVFVPVSLALGYFRPDRHIAVFVTSGLALLPLAGYIGRASERLTDQLGGTIGGLLNATFGNAAELIIGTLALREGLTDLVKASITGSIIGNVLLVFGGAAVVGGVRKPVQRFDRTAAGLGTTMLLLSAIALVVPAVFHRLSVLRGVRDTPELKLDTDIAVVLFATYCLSLVFTFHTHRTPAKGAAADESLPPEGGSHTVPGHTVPSHTVPVGKVASAFRRKKADRRKNESAPGIGRAMLILLAATAGVALVSEVMVGSVSATAADLGFTQLFVGVVIVAFVGNAAEHYSAIAMAANDEMDAALAIAVGSSTQIALFVAPTLVFLSYAIAPQPMDLLFSAFEVVAIALAVLIISFIAHDGETHWMEGVQLLAVYIILALGFFYLPA